jgi:hypothetical protein
MPAFERVMRAYETQAELGRAVGVPRDVVHYWSRLGYIPALHALDVVAACAAAGVIVSLPELLSEAKKGRARVDARGGARQIRMTPISAENARRPEEVE